MNRLGQFIVLACFFVYMKSCNTADTKIGNSAYTILPYEEQELNYLFKNAKESKLSHEEIIIVETLIKETISTIQKKHHKDIENNKDLDSTEKKDFQNYQRQYIAVIDENSDKLIWINFFCQNFFYDTWKTEIVKVDDGGSCFFNLKVNLTTKTVFDSHINGLASSPISPSRNNTPKVPSRRQS